MSATVNYYQILGVSESASQDEIKSAYRQMAKKYHPDSQGGDKAAEEKFKEISMAYSVLGDKKKRQQYDLLRKGGFAGNYNFSGGGAYQQQFGEDLADNIQDIFNNLFGGFNGDPSGPDETLGEGFENIFKQKQRRNVGVDMESTITIPLEMAVNGGETIIRTGSNKRVKIRIPAGVTDGKRIRIRGQGGAATTPQGKAGDLYLTIKVAPHPEFERRGNDIYSNIYINIAEAVLGTVVQANTVSGKKVKLKIPPGTSSGKVFRIPGMGIPGGSQKGDHYVRVEIDVPPTLSLTQKREFKNWARKVGLLKNK